MSVNSVNAVPPISLLLKVSIFIVGMFAFLQVYSIQAIFPVLMQTFLASETQVGLAVGATVLAIALMSPFMGMLSDAYGRKPFIVVAMLALALPTALIGFADNLQSVIVWRFLQGLAVPAITVVTIAYVAEEFTGKAHGILCGGYGARWIFGKLFAWAFGADNWLATGFLVYGGANLD